MVYGAHWLANRIIALFKILLLCLCAWFFPRIFVLYAKPVTRGCYVAHSSFRLGLENISSDLVARLSKKRVGLITNQTGKDQYGQHTSDVLCKKGINIAKIFVPEPNFNNELYDIDVLVFDIQDSGMRQSALYEIMKVASRYDKQLVVLDRPNPLGTVMEGPLTPIPVPARHGMTVGELADYYNKHVLNNPIDLEVVPMKNYNRKRDVPKDLLASLSPNIKSISSCLGNSFLGLLGEVDNIDVGVGTDKAFQCLMLPDNLSFPKKKWYELHLLLQKHGVESKFYSHFSKRRNQPCSGLLLQIRDINTFSGFGTLLAILDFFKKAGIELNFSHSLDKERVAAEINAPLQKFFAQARDSFMYYPLPKVIEL